ncbi:MAG: phosphoribosylformylglycinamidine synthase subunit PurQ [Candidatus Micrarchaeota archaeon]
MVKANALVLDGYGINCPHETAYAVRASGGAAEIRHVGELAGNPGMLGAYNMVVFPGGFSFGDDIASARVLANRLKYRAKDELRGFVSDGKLVLGICNGFQALVKMGLLPKPDFVQRVTLTYNASGKFEDRWVRLRMNQKSPCVFTKGIEYLDLPVRHGEGRFIPESREALEEIAAGNMLACQYVDFRGELAGYPYNPNGSVANTAGICDPSGRIFGLMPHPEAFNHFTNHPGWTRGIARQGEGLKIFRNAVEYIESNL